MQHHSIPPTTLTSARVPARTLRDSESTPPRHGCACARRPSTSSPSRRRSSESVVARTNDSSVSRFAERELRFVEPKSVSTGGSSGVGRTHMPGSSFQPSSDGGYVRRGRGRTFCVICPAFALPLVQLHAGDDRLVIGRPFTPRRANGGHETPLEERVCFRNASGDTSGFVESVRLTTKGRNSSATDDLRGEGGAHSRAGGENPAS